MRLTNETGLPAAWTVSFRPDGREALVIVAKATYTLWDRFDVDSPHPAPELAPLLQADVFGRDPAKNAPRFETDFAPVKPECDVLLVGSAHTPRRRPTQRLAVRLRVGSVSKTFVVTGRRVWQPGIIRELVPGDPQPFVSQPISYDVAFGGTDTHPRDPGKVATFSENPVGRGFRRYDLELFGHPMPVTEEANAPIRSPKQHYRPMAFGPLGRNWQPRAKHAGTYDQTWLDSRAPLLPRDFDPRYFQAAPPDQRMAYPKGGERIELVHLVPTSVSPSATATNRLPRLRLAAAIVPARGAPVVVSAQIDTIVFEPDANRFTCTWRATHALDRDAFEVRDIVIGPATSSFRARLRSRASGKQHFSSLGELVRSRRKGKS
jgi:hypothetical protein